MSTPETLTRELAALDDALAGRPVDPDLADLAELAILVRDERPAPDPAFAHSLDERAERLADRLHELARRPQRVGGRLAGQGELLPGGLHWAHFTGPGGPEG